MVGAQAGPRAPLTGPLDLQLWASARPTRCTGSAATPACRPAPTRSIAAPASAPSAASAQKVRPPPSQDPRKAPRAGPLPSHPRLGARTCGPRRSAETCPREGSASLCPGWSSPSGIEAAAGQGLPPRGQHPGRGQGRGWGLSRAPTGGGGVPGPQPQEAALLQGWFWTTSPKTTAACLSPSAPARSAGWSMPLGRSRQPPARPGEC